MAAAHPYLNILSTNFCCMRLLNSTVNHLSSPLISCILFFFCHYILLCLLSHPCLPLPPLPTSATHPHCCDWPLSISQAFEKQLKDEKDSYERRIRELQLRLDDARRESEVEATAIKTDLRLAREDVCRLQQDLEDAEEKLKDGEGYDRSYVTRILLVLPRTYGNLTKRQKCTVGFILIVV